jgi:DNA (cytosine-5)-methyltransferase 1
MRVLSLASGVGGIELGLAQATSERVDVVAVADPDPDASKVLACRYPQVPNLGDVTAYDFSELSGSVDVVTAGYPCQPFSHAGNRLAEKDPRHIWPSIFAAIHTIQPGYVVLENVIGHVKLGLNQVVNDLESVGYDVAWQVFSAADTGMPHRRKRVFVLARMPHLTHPFLEPNALTPAVLSKTDELLPTPTPFTLHNRENPDEWQARWVDVKERTGTRHGLPLSVALRSLHEGTPIRQQDKSGPRGTIDPYQVALTHWQNTFGEPLPLPLVTPNPKRAGDTLVNPAVVEWLMSFPYGFVSEVPDITVKNKLKLLGNAVAPYQAAHAITALAARSRVAAAVPATLF